MYQANTNQKKARETVLILDRADFKARKLVRNKRHNDKGVNFQRRHNDINMNVPCTKIQNK